MPPLVGTTAALLLALRPGPASGLVLIERIAQRTGGKVRPPQGSVYPTLKALRRKGLVRRLGTPEGSRRGRAPQQYELTLAGVRASDRARQAMRSLLGLGPERAGSAEEMREGVRQGLALSRFAARLRRPATSRSGGR